MGVGDDDDNRHPISFVSRQLACAFQLSSVLGLDQRTTAFIFITDSLSARAVVNAKYSSVAYTPNTIVVHTDESDRTTPEQNAASFVDLILLTDANGTIMSNSGFSRLGSESPSFFCEGKRFYSSKTCTSRSANAT